MSQEELETYSRARTLVDWTPEEIKLSPSLYKLRCDGNEDALPMILRRVGERAAAMIAEFRNIACDERVYSEWNVGSPIATWREMGPNESAIIFFTLSSPIRPEILGCLPNTATSPRGIPLTLRTWTTFG